jgi:hypothetical protein
MATAEPMCPVCDKPVFKHHEQTRIPEYPEPEADHTLGKMAHRKCAEGDAYEGVGSDETEEPDYETGE